MLSPEQIIEQAEKKGLALEVEISPKVGAVCSDRRRVEQVLLNLLSNAIRYTPDGGQVMVTADIDADGCLDVAIIDNGSGIADRLLPLLFSPFGIKAAHIADTGPQGRSSTGLGLSICKGLLEVMGGDLKIESEFGVGTIVIVRVPLHAPGKPLQDNVPERRHEVA